MLLNKINGSMDDDFGSNSAYQKQGEGQGRWVGATAITGLATLNSSKPTNTPIDTNHNKQTRVVV